MYYVYVLYSLKDKGMYIGQTAHLIQRIKQHQSGKVKSTKSRRPFVLVYMQKANSRAEALQLEAALKTSKGRRILRKRLKIINIK